MSDTSAPPEEKIETPAKPTESAGRYSLADDGQIFFQENASNPLPGVAVGRIVKGAALLSPDTDYEPAREWLAIHVRGVLEPLFLLKQEAGEGALPEGPARAIGDKLYAHLGVIKRTELEGEIAGLDPDLRKALRGKGVRLGPILAFLPALVKPAAVKMRALLWGLWHDKALPMARPVDGRVSEVVDPAAIDPDFYRMIGYPVFGPRAIRIDMLDRVVTDVYDSAVKGVFEAKHKYAEWLGTNLDGLYAILEAMGHRRLKEDAAVAAPAEMPAAEPVVEAAAVAEPESEPASEPTPEPASASEAPLSDAIAAVMAEAPSVPKPAPVSVKFMLRRGRMSDQPQGPRERRGGHDRKPRERNERQSRAGHEKRHEDRNVRTDAPKKAYDPNKPQRPKHHDGDRPSKPRFDKKRERDFDRDRAGRVYTFEGKKSADDADDGNPFAILKNLKQ